MHRFVVISGCSGGGKSTLLEELRRRGHAVMEEPGRRIVREEQQGNGAALPWIDPAAFARRAVAMALADLEAAAKLAGWVFFDRGLIDAAAALEHVTGEPVVRRLGMTYRYHPLVFFAPPWSEIYATDGARRHGFAAAKEEYRRLRAVYPSLGYQVEILPKIGIVNRADFLLGRLAAHWRRRSGPALPAYQPERARFRTRT